MDPEADPTEVEQKMRRMSVREFRKELSRAISLANQGERVVVTVDGTPMAQLGPIEPLGRDAAIEDLAAKGLISLASRSDRPEPTFSMPMWAGTRMDLLVREVRGR